MVRILQETQKGRTLDEAVTTISKEYFVDPDQDLNKLDDEQLARKKKVCFFLLDFIQTVHESVTLFNHDHSAFLSPFQLTI